MNHLNSLVLEGDVVKIVSTESCTTVTISVKRFYNDKNGDVNCTVSYFDFECYGHLAETVKQEATEGRGIRIIGSLSQRRWMEGNEEKSKVICIAEYIEYKGKRRA